MRYADFPNPKKPKLVAKSSTKFAYAIGEYKGREYCVITKREMPPDTEIPGRVRVRPTLELFKFAPMDWEAV